MTECIIFCSASATNENLERCVEQRGNTKRNGRWNRTEKFFVFLLRFYDFKLNSGAWIMLSSHEHQGAPVLVLVGVLPRANSHAHSRDVWNGKKSPFFAYCIHRKKQLISLVQAFNTVPPRQQLGEPLEKKKLCVEVTVFLLLPLMSSLPIECLDCCHITHHQVCDFAEKCFAHVGE